MSEKKESGSCTFLFSIESKFLNCPEEKRSAFLKENLLLALRNANFKVQSIKISLIK